jgi:Neutral/alkaline non-lysosomal ceramidase, N-terminal
MFESTEIIGQMQFEHAFDLMSNANEKISGGIDYRQSYVKMPGLNVTLKSGQVATLCWPAMGNPSLAQFNPELSQFNPKL